MTSQVNPKTAVVVIVVVVIVVFAAIAMKTGNNSKRLDTGLTTDKFSKDPLGAKKALADDIQKYKDKK